MRWLKPSLRSSLLGLLGTAPMPSESALDMALEDIREAMLEALGSEGAQRHPHVVRRVRYAGDVQGLWYLRSDLMAALSAQHGEAQARERLRAITNRFRGLLPAGLNSRPSPLND